jgi:hypothetical protein
MIALSQVHCHRNSSVSIAKNAQTDLDGRQRAAAKVLTDAIHAQYRSEIKERNRF